MLFRSVVEKNINIKIDLRKEDANKSTRKVIHKQQIAQMKLKVLEEQESY